MLSPFRYPGGKTWLVPLVGEWLAQIQPKPAEFIEPFAGGGSVALSVAFGHLAEHVTFVELDDSVADVWSAILGGHASLLADRVESFECTLTALKDALRRLPDSIEERAFRTILLNRVRRGGILAAGAGLLRDGENGKGIFSRWYPGTLKLRILEVASMKDRITFIRGDGLTVMEQFLHCEDAAFFIDPPYTADEKRGGRRLYTHHSVDHNEVFRLASCFAGRFLMTYDNSDEVRSLAKKHGLEVREIAMRDNNHATRVELLLGRDLSWLGEPSKVSAG